MENKLKVLGDNARLSPNYYKHDHSDRKATDMLINSLFSKDITPPKLKQSSLDQYWSNSQESTIPKHTKNNTQFRRQKHAKKLSNVSSPTLTSLNWLNMVNQKNDAANRNEHNQLCDNQTKQVSETPKSATTKTHANMNIDTSEILKELSGSCRQHGNETYEELLEEKERIKKGLECVVYKATRELPDSTEFGVKYQGSIVDCSHLSLAQIEQAFMDNFNYISCFYNREHESQMEESWRKISRGTVPRIVSMIVFTDDQKQVLASLLYKYFGQYSDYYYTVLLPELCMKIFMDVFDLSYEAAYDYLNERPA